MTSVRTGWRWPLLAALPLLIVLGFRLAGPEDLDDNDQAKQALYVLDIYQNGNWLLPQERGTQPATKPPLYAWLATATSAALGGPSPLGCRLPSVLASLGVVLLLFRLGAERWGPRTGALAAWIYAASHVPIALAIHVRPDVVLTLLLTASLFALHRLELGRPRGAAPLFWVSLALAVLTKGPVALLIALGGVLALALSAESRARLVPLLRSGWSAALALPVLWLLLAYFVGGSDYIHQTVLAETVERVLASGSRAGKAVPFGYLIAHFTAKFAPWSPFALCATALLATARGRRARPLLVLPCGGFAVGLLLLNLSKGQRADYLLPLLPPAALVTAALLAEGAPWVRRMWRVELVALGLACALAGAAALLAPHSVGSLLEALGRPWGAAVCAAGLALLATATRKRPEAGRPLAVAVAALLTVHAAYNGALSPVARDAREPDVRDFVAGLRHAERPDDQLEILAGVPSSVFFLLSYNEPSVTADDVATYTPWAPPNGRRLLISSLGEQHAFEQRWPGRFCALLTREFRHTSGGLVLLEDSALQESATRESAVERSPSCTAHAGIESGDSALRGGG